jgi:hypothetical protein
VSELAACVGFHPYKDLIQLALQHVYQGSEGEELLKHDASLLGLQMESEEQILLDIANRAGKPTLEALQSALQVQKGQKQLTSVDEAKNLCEKVVRKAMESKKLSESQIKQLQQGSIHSIYTGFGNFWESQALDIYEQRYGVDVRERNEEIRIWPFSKVSDSDTVKPMQSAYGYQSSFLDESYAREAKRQKQTLPTVTNFSFEESSHHKHDCLFSLRGAIDGIRDELVPNSEKEGTIDGDDDSWILRPVIVECKHRMNRIQDSPPIYEMIQTIAYCQMHRVTEADLVQVLRTQPQMKRPKEHHRKNNTTSRDDIGAKRNLNEEKEANEKCSAANHLDLQSEKVMKASIMINEETSISTQNPIECLGDVPKTQQLNEIGEQKTEFPEPQQSSEKDEFIKENFKKQNKNGSAYDRRIPSMEISVNRISLEDPLHQHGENWKATILPRLRSWVEAVYEIRGSDEKRYTLLVLSSSIISTPDTRDNGEPDTSLQYQRKQEHDAWNLLFTECPWLLHCDTKYNREFIAK